MSAEQAAKHHTDLNIFAAVMAILEGGCVYTANGLKAAHKIIGICKKEQQRQLSAYVREVK